MYLVGLYTFKRKYEKTLNECRVGLSIFLLIACCCGIRNWPVEQATTLGWERSMRFLLSVQLLFIMESPAQWEDYYSAPARLAARPPTLRLFLSGNRRESANRSVVDCGGQVKGRRSRKGPILKKEGTGGRCRQMCQNKQPV